MASYVRSTTKSGITYIYENHSFWDKELKKTRHIRRCIGHVDPETGEIVPNRPKKANGLGPKAIQKAKKAQDEVIIEQVGIDELMSKAAKETGLQEIIDYQFPNDAPAIMTCAYYLAYSGNPLYRMENWTKFARTPYGSVLASQRVSELLQRLSYRDQQAFFRQWIRYNESKEYFAIDITSVSSYSELNKLVKYGYNRDHEKLPQVNVLMITGEKSHLPVYYRPIDGSIKDVQTLKDEIRKMELFDRKKLHAVMDKGFYSKSNIDEFYEQHYKFIVGVPFTDKLARDAVEENRETIESHHNIVSVLGNEVYGTTKMIKWGSHRCYIHTYFDSDKAAGEAKEFLHKLKVTHDELEAGEEKAKNKAFYEEYFIVHDYPKRKRKVEYNEEAIAKHKKNRIGWLVLVSNDINDAQECLKIYREKDAVEKNFDDLKNEMDMKRLRVRSEQAMEGRFFLQFVALILLTWIRQKLDEGKLLDRFSYREIMDEVNEIKIVESNNGKKSFKAVQTKLQKEIIQLFKLDDSSD